MFHYDGLYHPKWTEEEVGVLKEYYPRLGMNVRYGPVTKKSLLSLLPNKSWGGIRYKSEKLGLKKDFRLVYPPLQILDVEKAYIAGYLDGEGCLTVIRQKRKSGHINYYPYISISNKDLDSLKWIEEVVGVGRVRRLTPTKVSERSEKWRQRPWTWSDCYTWGTGSFAGCYRFLTDIKPYIKVKKEHTNLLLEFIDIKANKPKECVIRDEVTGYFIKKLPLETLDREHEIHDRFRELNSRGWRKYD